MALTAEQTGSADLIIRDDDETVCEIWNLHLRNARFRPGGRLLIGATVPLPLFWEQYADHEDPERNAGSHASLEILQAAPDMIRVECTGSNFSRTLSSLCTLEVTRIGPPLRYEYTVHASMVVEEGAGWLVTPNPQQGELEFCNLWPDGVFAADPAVPLLTQGTYVRQGECTLRIPHHHLESPDKANIPLFPGDRVAWLLEEENLCCTILDTAPVVAGLCAYMWDLHLAYRVCHHGVGILLPPGTTANAHYRLSSLTHDEGRDFMEGAVEEPSGAAGETALFRNGISLASDLSALRGTDLSDLWPWEKEILQGEPGEILFSVEPDGGPRGRPALSIVSASPVHAAWRVSGLGPAFRHPPFPRNARYRLTVRVQGRTDMGNAAISIRLHREGAPALHDTSTYETFTTKAGAGAMHWREIEIVTPPISPSPDRMHLLLELHGAGACSFADVQFESLP